MQNHMEIFSTTAKLFCMTCKAKSANSDIRKLQKPVDNRRVTAACHECQVLWLVGIQQACQALENS